MIPRMRLLDEAYKEIVEADPDTAITKYYLRSLIVDGTIPTIRAGKKRLINMDALSAYLSGDHLEKNKDYGNIRRVV